MAQFWRLEKGITKLKPKADPHLDSWSMIAYINVFAHAQGIRMEKYDEGIYVCFSTAPFLRQGAVASH